ncbi:hypothetical protein RHGRI_025545 [Rhododendron griersonianum]|uniref:Uncharacterized protein n=1 Tax=Rhododendron griersonianum TaxID=479676 RepID=A0AAV6IPQ3_9ERIC|nr:hypothetical protein RHGRI_025545 [Rhododendron griersonianum]
MEKMRGEEKKKLDEADAKGYEAGIKRAALEYTQTAHQMVNDALEERLPEFFELGYAAGAEAMADVLVVETDNKFRQQLPPPDACRYFLYEMGFALFVALLINIAIISVSATICSDPSLSGQCNNITLNSASFLLQNVLRKSSSTIYAIALLASGQSSTITCTYAGQFIMQMILSFELPFSLIPLLKFSSSTSKMGPYKSSIYIIVISWILGLGIIGINIYYLSTSFVGWVIHSTLPKAATVFISIVVFPMMVIYVASVIYLMWRKDTVVTYIDTTKIEPAGTEDGEDSIVPYREDLADIPLPQ